MFQSQSLKTDVTSAKLIGDYILAGVGNFLHVYHRDNKTAKLLYKHQIFHGHNIHGIEVDVRGENVVCFGGSHLITLKSNWKTVVTLHVFKRKIMKDWILTANWLNNNRLGLVLMSNKLVICNHLLDMEREVFCEEKCILYSSCIHFNTTTEEVFVFSGTVFNEVLVWKVKLEDKSCPVLARLKGHKGVVFSLSYNSGHLCSCSDDRSTIIWTVKLQPWEVTLKCKVYGHQSRIFRCLMLADLMMVISAGEDSCLNIWTTEGQLVRKVHHQGGSIWALDSDGTDVLFGGGNGALALIPIQLSVRKECWKLSTTNHTLKRVGIMLSNNLALITEDGVLLYLIRCTNIWKTINHHLELRNYSLLEVSKCRRLLLLCGFHGEVFLYREQDQDENLKLIHTLNTDSRIFSCHWLTCLTFLTCQQDNLILWCLHHQQNRVSRVTTWSLSNKKMSTTTAACQIPNGSYVVGDRGGHLHLFHLNFTKSIQSIKAHNYLGITCVYYLQDRIVSLGRNGVVNFYKIVQNDGAPTTRLTLISGDKVPFNWLVGYMDGLLLTFSSQNFLIWDYQTRRTLVEFECGGGHRSWDFFKNSNKVIFVYVKNGVVKVSMCDCLELYPTNVMVGYHTNTVNALQVVTTKDTNDGYVVVSGSEDTNLRISLIGKNSHFVNVRTLKWHLSSVRTITCHYQQRSLDTECLLFSGGGRGQILCWSLCLDTFESSLRCNYHDETVAEEVRIMDLHVLDKDNDLYLLAGTSEGKINIFSVVVTMEAEKCNNLDLVESLSYKRKCITKVRSIKTFDLHYVIMSTDVEGSATFWNFSQNYCRRRVLGSIKIHQSGVNSCSLKTTNQGLVLLLSGGDDNCIRLDLIQLLLSVELVVCLYQDSWSHCAQITGCFLSDAYFITASVDQKLRVFTWRWRHSHDDDDHDDDGHCDNVNTEEIIVDSVARYDTTVADVQGIQCYETETGFDIFLYGHGVEYVKYYKNSTQT